MKGMFSSMEQEVCAATLVSAMRPVRPGLELWVEMIRPPPGACSSAHTTPFTRNFKGNNASCKPRARSPHLSTASLHGKCCLQKRDETEEGGSEVLPEATASSAFRPPSLLPLLLALAQVDKQSYKSPWNVESPKVCGTLKTQLFFLFWTAQTFPRSLSRAGDPRLLVKASDVFSEGSIHLFIQ